MAARRTWWQLLVLAAALLVAVLIAVVVAGPTPRADARLRFVDVAKAVGLDVRHSAFGRGATTDPVAMMGGGLCWIDVDRDGWLDLFLTDAWSNGEWGLWNDTGEIPTTRLFRNNEGVFEEYTSQWGAALETRANGCVAADLNDDGYTDLYVTTGRANYLLWNEAGAGFVEGAQAAGVDAYGWHTGVAAGDLDGNGTIDLVVAGYADLNRGRPEAGSGFPNTFQPVTDVIFMNEGSASGEKPTFRSVGQELGLEPDGPEYGLGVVLVDFDDDGDLDLHIANDTQPNRLYLNEPATDLDSDLDSDHEGAITLVDVSSSAGADDANSGMGIAPADVDGDGRNDLLVTNLAGQGHSALLSGGRVQGAPRYRSGLRAVRDLGLGRTSWGASFGDLDLDGDLDLIVASGAIPIEDLTTAGEPIVVFRNDGSAVAPRFTDSTPGSGVDAVAARNGRAVALADYDNDGDLDAVISAIGQPLVLLENRTSSGNWLIIDAGVPRPGTHVRVVLPDRTELVRTTVSGSSWLSSEDPRVHIGLGPFDRISVVEVTRPDGSVDRFEDLAANQILKLTS